MSPSVIHDWVVDLPWKQQSILFSGLRGPDHALCPATKLLVRWMRGECQHNADPSKGYMAEAGLLPSGGDLEPELEHAPCHFVHHLADALAVIAYNHPETEHTRPIAYAYHYYIAEELFHFVPEAPDIFAWRHRDKPGGVDPAPQKPYDDRPWAWDLLDALEGNIGGHPVVK